MTTKRYACAAVLAAALLAACGGGNGDGGKQEPTDTGSDTPRELTLSWSAPTTNADGSALSDLAGYRVYVGTASGDYGSPIEIDDAATTSHTLKNLEPATYYLTVKAVDTSGNESVASTEVSKRIE